MAGAQFLKSLSTKYYMNTQTNKNDYTKKPDYYFDIYASYFDSMRERPLEILELGIYSGASLLIWREYFPNAKIVGLDISPPHPALEPYKAEGRILSVQGNQGNPSDLQRCLDLTSEGRFDVIIDDASHKGSLSRASFDFLFVNGLKEQGLYFVEDFATSYAPDFGGAVFTQPPPLNMEDNVFPSHEVGMIGWLKQLVDEITTRYYGDRDMPSRPIASGHFWPNIALITKLGASDYLT
jgi:predicted O-methyltransferase YrrM